MAGIAYGQSNAPDLPQVDLPTFDNGQQQPAQQPLRVLITPQQQPQPQDATGGWAPFTAGAPAQGPQQTAPPNSGDAQTADASGGWAPFQPQNATPPAEVGTGEAALRGAAHGLTFGFYPAIAGAAAGAKAALTGDGDFSTAYDQTRQQEEAAQQQAEKQHPYVTAAADVAGSLPSLFIPGVGMGKAAMMGAEALPRIVQGVRAGAVAGGLFGAGDQTSKGGSALDIAEGAGGGVLAGGALGGVFGSGVEGASKVAQRVGSIVRGQRDSDAEAARLAIGALKGDEKQVGKVASDRAGLTAAQDAGTDVRLADYGGGNTKGLLRAATNISPEARDIVGEPVVSRFQQQGDRVGRYIRSHFGGIENDVGVDAIKAHARKQNGPLYRAAYAAGQGGMWSPELERLASAPAVLSAVQGATERGGNRAVAEGMGAFNPHVTFENGILRVSKKGGVPSHPDMQFWDYVQRELRDLSEQAKRAGRMEEADAISSLHRQLLGELDRINPRFAKARGTAAAFFKASDALQAGANFVHDTSISERKAMEVIAKMTPAERELFKRGFSGELAARIERISDNRNVLNSIFLNNGPARRRILIALGQEDAGRLEALLRIEGIVDRTRRALINSTTIQEGHDASKFAGTLAAIESVKGALNPAYLIAIPLIWAGRHTAKEIDERVFSKVAELLMSEDPAVLSRGLQIAAKNPNVRTALRYASDLTARELVSLLGPSGVGAGALTMGEHLKGAAHDAAKEHPADNYDNQGQQVAPP